MMLHRLCALCVCIVTANSAFATGALRTIVLGVPEPSPPQTEFLAPFDAPRLNDAGHVAFIGVAGGGGGLSIWTDGLGTLQLIAREGDMPPGVADGAVLGQFANNSYTLNTLGQTAFIATLTGNDVTTDNDEGIWATDTSGTLHLIAREGETIWR